MSKKPKTEGLEWLLHSLNSFNGSGYADMNSAQDYLDSYKAYKSMRNKPQAVRLADLYKLEALGMIEELLDRTYGAGRKPSEKSLERFNTYRKQHQARLM